MTNQINTLGITLARVDYEEADRIVTVMTRDHGKLSLLAKGVRRIKSKLAGGIELFSISELTYLEGRKDIHTLISARLLTHYGQIVKSLERTTFGYRVLQTINRQTESNADGGYFELIKHILEALNQPEVPLPLIDLWFALQLLQLEGQTPNLSTDTEGHKLVSGDQYTFDLEAMGFAKHPEGMYSENHIKIMRLLLMNPPEKLLKVKDAAQLAGDLGQLAKLLTQRRIT